MTPDSVTRATRTFRAMATDVTVRIENAAEEDLAFDLVVELFASVERECTRFDPNSPLMRANAAGTRWYDVPEFCFAAVQEAFEAYRATDGLFDPRVLDALKELGYDRSLPFASGAVSIDLPASARGRIPTERRQARTPWQPRFDHDRGSIMVGPVPIDLGGIGKGLAVRWAAEALSRIHRSFLIEAGGDCYVSGEGPVDGRWNVGVEDPGGGTGPVAVLSLTDSGCTTSSVRYRSWRIAGRPVHHLIDPRTGEPGRGGLRAVTVVHPDPARAEVWSKALFLTGLDAIAHHADAHGLAALWIDDLGTLDMTASMLPHVIWRKDATS